MKRKNANKSPVRVQIVLAVVMAIFGCLMIVAAFIVPPTGEIHPSVLTAFGEVLTFAGTVVGIDYSYKSKGESRKSQGAYEHSEIEEGGALCD